MARPHIAILFEYPSLSGGEFSMLATLETLRERFQFSACLPAEGPLSNELRKHEIPIVDFSIHAAGSKLSPEEVAKRLSSFIERNTPDLLHANSLSMSRMMGRICEDIASPFTGHLRDIMKLSGKAIQDLACLQHLVAVSQATADYHIEQGLPPDQVTVIHNGVDLDQFQPRPHNVLRAELGLADSAILIGSIGQICIRKGFDLLPQVADRLDCRQHDIHCCLVGERYSSKQESIDYDLALDEEFERLGLSAHFHRLGFRNDVSVLLNEFDVLLHTARQEPLGRVLLEAAASGCAIVAAHVGGTPEIVTHEESALLFPVDDAEHAAAHIQRVIADATLREELSRNARRRMEKDFSIRKSAQKLAELWTAQLD